jgi:phosphoglycolate phosphatase (TIGR01487 family)
MYNSPFQMLATDYDGTIATDGAITNETEKALLQAKEAGFLLALVTGREFDDLLRVCQQIKIFDLVVAENGAVLYFPVREHIEILASPPADNFILQLIHRNIPFSRGRVIVSVQSRYEEQVCSLIDKLELPLYIIRNKDAAMILPLEVDKAKGLGKGLRRFRITNHQVIAIGDAENDLALLQFAGFRVAVANADDVVKNVADWVTYKSSGDGVTEFIHKYLVK